MKSILFPEDRGYQSFIQKNKTTVKIGNLPKSCNNSEHLPPNHRAYKDGIYQHTCPGCKNITRFAVNNPSM